MTRDFFQSLTKSHPLLLDGATGTNLQKAGMPVGVCPEQWILDHPEKALDLQKSFVAAGTKILYAPTFTGNRIKLAEYGLADRLKEINTELIRLCRQAAGDTAYVAGDMTMTGRQLFPLGDLPFEELMEVYREQAEALLAAGCDLFVVETMMSLQETRAAVIAIRELSEEIPIMTSLTFDENGKTLFGSDPVTSVVVLQSLGADAVGMNCSTGPEDMLPLIGRMKEYATVPLLAKPNAGLPELDDNGNTIYRMTPETFASYGSKLIDAGASILGGCCGTEPSHIKALADAVKDLPTPSPRQIRRRVVTSERRFYEITLDGTFGVVGERINPTGKKKLQEQLRAGSLSMVKQMAKEQDALGAAILDVNMGVNGIDERQMMLDAIDEVAYTVDTPLCIDSSSPEVIESALRLYPGRALLNSVSLESEKITKILPLAKKYGAMFILLPVSDEGLPKDQETKRGIIHAVMEKAKALGMAETDIVVDGLVATVGAEPTAALECLETIRYCKEELRLATICGLSNISFGLPQRLYVNTAFLSMAISKGLTLAIANPSQELLLNVAYATDLLLNKEDSSLAYINRMNALYPPTEQSGAKAPASSETKSLTPGEKVYQDVLNGEKQEIVEDVKVLLSEGKAAGEIINEFLIPGINEVGDRYEKQIYFLPQLISSANAMKAAMDHLEPFLGGDSAAEAPATIVIATVEGDIHDIGKNLVVLMLKNYGYRVIDLGKDIAAEEIVDRALAENAEFIGLSALMTTTMMRMKDVVTLAKERHYPGKIIIGGACITESFADEIGADGYAADAADCVKVVQRLLG
ncbi:MAG: homocysteine S-methyltransferase family protein [Lachnospiraceae bacterium]|nr:homocysteine S-methyltransferase family protein [Lachnospiraceae bacterium]